MKLAAILTLCIVVALLFAVGCFRNSGHSVETVRDALTEGLAFCNAHSDDIPPELLSNVRRAYERGEWKKGAKALLGALQALRALGVEIPDRVAAAEAIARALLNSQGGE